MKEYIVDLTEDEVKSMIIATGRCSGSQQYSANKYVLSIYQSVKDIFPNISSRQYTHSRNITGLHFKEWNI